MSEQGNATKVRINLTVKQATQVKAAIGREVDAIELTVQELEQRVVPTLFTSAPIVPVSNALAANSNETLLVS